MSQEKKGSLFMRGLEALFSLSGKADRKEFIVALIFLFILGNMCFFMMAALPLIGRADGLSMLLVYLIFALPATILQTKRLKDAGLQRHLSWLIGAAPQFVVPVIAGILLQHHVQNVPWPGLALAWSVLLAALPTKREEPVPQSAGPEDDGTDDWDDSDDEDAGEDDDRKAGNGAPSLDGGADAPRKS